MHNAQVSNTVESSLVVGAHHCSIDLLTSDSLLPQLSEITILETIEKLTDPVAPEGEWITKIDLVRAKDPKAAYRSRSPFGHAACVLFVPPTLNHPEDD